MRHLLLIYFLCSSFLNAQQQLDKGQFDNGVDYVTCICMKEVVKSLQVDCKKTKIEKKDIPSDQSRSIGLFEEFQSLKLEKGKTVDFLANEIFKNEMKFKKISAFARKYTSRLDDIKLNIENFFITIDTKQSISDPPEIKSGPSQPQREELEIEPAVDHVITTDKETAMQPSYIEANLLALVMCIVLILFIFYIIFSKIELKKEIKIIHGRIDRRMAIKDQNPETNKNSGNSNLENKIHEVSQKIIALENKVKLLDLKSYENPVIPPIPILQQETVSDTFYMSVPNEDGTFDVNGDTGKESALYEFIVDRKNPSVAKFAFVATDSRIIQSVVDYSQSYINPACDAQNALNQNAKKIITIRPGIVEKRNDRWIITTKSQIKYE